MIRFRMAKINMDQFAILSDKAPSEGIYYNVSINFKAALNTSRIACMFSVEFAHDDKPILKLGISCEFDIHWEDWDNRIEGKKLTITKEELGFFANQTVGTARGIMYCKTSETDFRNFILPPVDLTKILNEDLVIEFADD